MDKKDNNMENWKGLANRLRKHEEPYKIGAWEKFEADFLDAADSGNPVPIPQDPKVRRIGTSWRIWSSGVAAAALLIFGLIWLWPASVPRNDLQDSPQMVQSPAAILPNQAESSFQSTSDQSTSEVEKHSLLGLDNELFESDPSDSFEILPPVNQLRHELSLAGMKTIVIEPSFSLHHSDRSIEVSRVENIRTSSAMAKEKNGLLSSVFGDLNEDLSINTAIGGDKVINRDKWALGVAVASMMTSSEEVNVGGGISVAYKLSDRMFLRSGISLAILGVSTPAPGRKGPSTYVGYAPASNGSATDPSGPSGPQGPGGSQGSSGSFKESTASVSPEAVPGYYTRLLRGASSNLLTLDVPLDLKYFVTDKYFTSVGVSFLGILNESRTNHYIENINQPLFNGYSANGQDLQFAVKTLHVHEATAYQPLQGNSYAGYLNFSVGRQTRVSNKISLSIEPFFKLPVGKLMREDMNMTNGGIRIVTGF